MRFCPESIHYLHKDFEEPKIEEVGEDDAADKVEEAEKVEDNDVDPGACLDDELPKDSRGPVAELPGKAVAKDPEKPVVRFPEKAVVKVPWRAVIKYPEKTVAMFPEKPVIKVPKRVVVKFLRKLQPYSQGIVTPRSQ